MTRSEFLLIAAALKSTQPHNNRLYEQAFHQHFNSCYAVANAIAEHNKSFDKQLFLTNCGIKS